MKKSPVKRRKSIIVIFVVLIVLLALLSVVPLMYRLITGPGVKTEPLSDSGAAAASTPVDGNWESGDQPRRLRSAFAGSDCRQDC